jgi:hypothetical protein
MWICCNASSFVLFDTKPRATVIGFVHEEDADAFRRNSSASRPTAARTAAQPAYQSTNGHLHRR